MKPVMAVIVGVLVDLLGTVIISVLFGSALGFYLLSQGVAQDELEAALIARLMQAPWNVIGFALGTAISVLAGYVTAKIAKLNVYTFAGIVGCISAILGYSSAVEHYSIPMNIALSLLTVAATLFGAFLWSRRNKPSTPATTMQ